MAIMIKITNMRIPARRIGAILLMTTLASGAILCAPSGGQQQAASANQKQQVGAHKPNSISGGSGSGISLASGATNAPPANNAASRPLSSVASELSSMPSLVSFRNGQTTSASSPLATAASSNGGQRNDEVDTFDGKNPFTDDSLWQIPVHFERELSPSDPSSSGQSPINSASNDNMAKSASEPTASADEHDDELGDGESIGIGSLLDHQQQQQRPGTGAAAEPALISASTTASDLKTAAGYHHATPHHYGDAGYHGESQHAGHHYGAGHHDAGNYHGGHHDHYGKYFQYASVPYPYAWDFGYRRGNPYHTIERYEHGKGPHFQTKVKWSDKHGGYGVHVWDYNHDDHSKHHYGGGDHHGHGYESHGPSHYGSHHHGHH